METLARTRQSRGKTVKMGDDPERYFFWYVFLFWRVYLCGFKFHFDWYVRGGYRNSTGHSS
jgi:hypothetical protein